MKLNDLISSINAETIHAAQGDIDIQTGYTSDLLSDVMAHAEPDSILMTIQAHKNTVAVALNADIRAILICNSRPVPADMLEAATNENIGIYRTEHNQYQTSWQVCDKLTNQ